MAIFKSVPEFLDSDLVKGYTKDWIARACPTYVEGVKESELKLSVGGRIAWNMEPSYSPYMVVTYDNGEKESFNL